MTSAEKYVLAAYLVVFAAVLVYVVIFAAKLARLEREISQLADLARARARQTGAANG
ncbi:MAG: CcmD family protein [Actinobacteria bacterium]|nr:CcmD family protein [Actinomycetota bacterium]